MFRIVACWTIGLALLSVEAGAQELPVVPSQDLGSDVFGGFNPKKPPWENPIVIGPDGRPVLFPKKNPEAFPCNTMISKPDYSQWPNIPSDAYIPIPAEKQDYEDMKALIKMAIQIYRQGQANDIADTKPTPTPTPVRDTKTCVQECSAGFDSPSCEQSGKSPVTCTKKIHACINKCF